MLKSQKQMESVKKSPEYLRCAQQEQLGYPLAPVCEMARHQASSIDEVRTNFFRNKFFKQVWRSLNKFGKILTS